MVLLQSVTYCNYLDKQKQFRMEWKIQPNQNQFFYYTLATSPRVGIHIQLLRMSKFTVYVMSVLKSLFMHTFYMSNTRAYVYSQNTHIKTQTLRSSASTDFEIRREFANLTHARTCKNHSTRVFSNSRQNILRFS